MAHLWQNYAASSVGSDTSSNAAAAAGRNDGDNQQNYVNFNQFIMQHNLSSPTSMMGGNNSNNSPNTNFHPSSSNTLGGGRSPGATFGDNYHFSDGNFFPHHTNLHTDAFKEQQQNPQNFFNSNSNHNPLKEHNSEDQNFSASQSSSVSFPFNNGFDSTNSIMFSPAELKSTNDSNHFQVNNNMYDTFYTPFATGFDFAGCSQLQASAPEFVPHFNKLSLSENKTEDAKNSFSEHNNNKNSIQNVQELKPDITNPINNHFEPSEKTDVSTSDASGLSNGINGSSNSLQRNGEQNLKRNSSNKSLNTSSSYTSNNNSGNNRGAYSKNTHGTGRIAGSNGIPHLDKHEKSRAEREREHDNRRLHGRRSVDFYDRDQNREEKYERDEIRETRERNGSFSGNHKSNRDGDRADRGDRGDRNRDYHRYDNNYRSNKRQDNWNRNRDRINGFRVEEKFSMDSKESPQSPDKKNSPKKTYAENEKLSQREKLVRDIEMRRLECLVCVEPIKSHQAVWSCNNCYHILHLQCIIKWASSSKSEDGWRCPACQNVVKEVPRDYYCFCGKVKNPAYNRQDVAHSCGEVCGRVEGCAHACTLLCHPGPCPPCQANVIRECGCGKTSKTMQCCLKEVISCEAECGKLLNCELHTCTAKCHENKCAACPEKVSQTCHCSKNERQVACTRDSHDKQNYSCGKPCGRELSCGNHKCSQCCHAGECKPCKLSPAMVTSCPCGKMPILEGQRSTCLDDIPICQGTCGKTLRCGKASHPHHCTNKCHLGNCPPCNKQTAVKCRCGHMDQMIKCRQLSTRADDARCKKRCTKKRSCGKHKCNQECCIDIDHICSLPCNHTLTCNRHKCDQPCHRGNCHPCYRSSFEELYCECGAEVIYPPVPCGTKRPTCKKACSRSHPCSHPPQHNCHSAVTCPPCMMFTTKYCFGKHEQRKTIPCSQESFSCGMACNKPLPCGRHKCIKTCHEGICQTAGEICKQSCTKLRVSCGHKCMAACHEGDCPETPCKEMVEVQCECGNRKQMRSCHDLAREYSRIATAQLASSMAEMQRGNFMELSEILAPVKTNKTNKTLDCSEECRLLERNRRLAIGLQVRNPDLPQKLNTKYSEYIRNFAKRDPILVKSIHDALTKLVKLAKESKQKSRSHSFPTMNRDKRQLVHEMCEMFGVDSVAYDAEPNRNVVATAQKDRSWLPATSIMEVMQRESGVPRRVPVPSNNAWGLKR